jgi:hypothetical protein
MRRFVGVKYRSFSSQRPFGVELELNNNLTRRDIKKAIHRVSDVPIRLAAGWDQSIGNRFWHIKTDATCGLTDCDMGWEVASYKCQGFEDVIHLGEVAASLKAEGARVNKNCGLHIHVEVADFTVRHVGILLSWWLKIEPVIMCAVPNHRTENIFCWPLRDIEAIKTWDNPTAFSIWNMFRPESIDVHENGDRHRAINLVNYLTSLYDPLYERITLEFRFPDGTINPADVMNWPRLLVNFVDNIKRWNMPANFAVCDVWDTLTVLGLHHDDNFYIFSEGLMRTRTWLLKRIMKYCRERKDWGLQARKILNEIYEPEKSYK